jgi:hypothetical protein
VAVGFVSWIVGLDFLLIGLGLWVRHKLARLVGLVVFILALFFECLQILFLGLFGASLSIVKIAITVAILYLLYSKYEPLTVKRVEIEKDKNL